MQLAKKHIKNSAAPMLSGKDKLKMQCEKKMQCARDQCMINYMISARSVM